MANDRKLERRYMRALEGTPIVSTRSTPQFDGRFWVVTLLCSDGRMRTFRTGPAAKTKGPRVGLSPQTRFDMLVRDQFRCLYCGRGSELVELQVDHVLPVARGGTNDPDNLVTACRDCNAGKSDAVLGFDQQ